MTPEEVVKDNALAADRACLALIGLGYAWDGEAWTLPGVAKDAKFYRGHLASLLRGICSTTHFPQDWEEMAYVQRAMAALDQ